MIELKETLYPLIFDESFVIFDRDTRNAKVIGYGRLGNRGDFKLLDRVKDFKRISDEDDEDKVTYSEVKTFKF